MSQAYVLFFSTSHALWAEEILIAKGMLVSVVSVPRHLSSDCGYCLQIPRLAVDETAAILNGEAVEFDRIHR